MTVWAAAVCVRGLNNTSLAGAVVRGWRVASDLCAVSVPPAATVENVKGRDTCVGVGVGEG